MDPAALYLDLLKGCLTRSLFLEEESREVALGGWRGKVWEAYKRLTKHHERQMVEPARRDPQVRAEGRDWPTHAETMIGHRRLDNLQDCVTNIIEDGIPGDLIEAGVWRGGAAILMRGVLAAYDVTDRTVWLADSFQGLPAPNAEKYPGDTGLDFTGSWELAIAADRVKFNFSRYGLLDDQVRFLVGWFKETLPGAPLGQLSVVRLDGDLYESTMDAISALYPRLSLGGYLIVDDYNDPRWATACRRAIDDYRSSNSITEPIREVDWTGVFWRRER